MDAVTNFDDPKQTDSLSTTVTTATTSSSSGVHSPLYLMEHQSEATRSQQQTGNFTTNKSTAQSSQALATSGSGRQCTVGARKYSQRNAEESCDNSDHHASQRAHVGYDVSSAKAHRGVASGSNKMSPENSPVVSDTRHDERDSGDDDGDGDGDDDDEGDGDGDIDCDGEYENESNTGESSKNRGKNGDEPSVKRKRRPRPQTGDKMQCAVCGDDAFGYNFDAVSCESCKAFFRRNALRQHVCQNGNQCKIDKESRKYCSSCRINKCLQVGMKRELILTPDKLQKRAKLVRKKKRAQHQSGESTCTSASNPHSHGGSGSGTQSAFLMHSSLVEPATRTSPTTGVGVAKLALKASASIREQALVHAHAQVDSTSTRADRSASRSNVTSSSAITTARGTKQTCETRESELYERVGNSPLTKPDLVRPGICEAHSSSSYDGLPTAHPHHDRSAIDPTGQHDSSSGYLAEVAKRVATLAVESGLGSDADSCTQIMHRERILAEMARVGLDAVNLAAFANTASAQLHDSYGRQLVAPQHAMAHMKQEQHSPPTSAASLQSAFAKFQPASPANTAAHQSYTVTFPTVNYDEMLAKCAVACEHLLRPLNANDMRQLRPASVAYEQFNYGEVFVRRFVSAFKHICDFRALGQEAQLKLLRSSMVSTLNIGGVFSFDVSRQAWVLQVESCAERVYLVKDMITLFELSGQTHIRDYMHSYCEFHTRLRNEFGSDVILFFVLILIDMFSPHRFTTDRDMLARLVPAHARYVQFLEQYLARNYGSNTGRSTHAVPEHSCTFDSHGNGRGVIDVAAAAAAATVAKAAKHSQLGSALPLDVLVKQKLDFSLDMLSSARTLEEYLAITSQYIGLTAMLPLLAEVCEQQLNENSDVE